MKGFAICCAALALAPAIQVLAQDAEPRPRIPPQASVLEPRATFSATRRFLVTGLAPAAAADVGRWADDVARRVEEWFGPPPFDRGAYVELACIATLEGGLSRVTREQALDDGALRQRLVMAGLEELDQEDALEGLVWLLLNRCAAAHRTAGAKRARPTRVPDWLAVGVAQNLYPELRQRTMRVGLERWESGAAVSPRILVHRGAMPEGRWAEKVDAALFVAWIESVPEAKAIFADALRRMAAGAPPTPAWWLVTAQGGADEGLAEREWELWVAQQRDARRGWGREDERGLRALRELQAWPETELYAVGAPDGIGTIGVRDLVKYRGEKWARRLANRAGVRLRLAAVGQSSEVQAVADRYAVFLGAVTGRAPDDSGGWFSRRPSARRLRALLREADAAFHRLEQDLRARDEYLTRVAAEAEEGPRDAPGEEARRYIDDVERRLRPPEPATGD